MAEPTNDFPVAVQEALISANLNSTLMFEFLMGIYTGVYVVTVSIYSSSDKHTVINKRVIISTLTVLYGTIALQALFTWFYTSGTFSNSGTTRLEIFVESVLGSTSPVLTVLSMLLQWSGFILADGLMIWRCYCACGKSLILVSLPIVFFISEFALGASNIVWNALTYFVSSFHTIERVKQVDHIAGAMYASVAATSVSTTFIIWHFIYSRTIFNGGYRRYKHIIDILIQSSAVYSAIAVATTVCAFLITGEAETSMNVVIVDNYFEGLSVIMTGLAPTVMVARLSVVSDSRDTEMSRDTCSSESVITHLP